MEQATANLGQLAAESRHAARRLLTIGENRIELLMVEVQEERERLLRAILLALGVATLGLLAGITLTGAIVVLLKDVSPAATLIVLTVLYGGSAVLLYQRLTRLIRDWETFAATLDQLRKDLACLKKSLS